MPDQVSAGARTAAIEVLVPGAERMRALGVRLAGLLRSGDLVVLTGALGAGKTTLAQGIGAGLAVRGPVTSPTFVIARVHPSLRGGPDLVHADASRLGSRLEVDDLDLDADLDRSVTVVEWGEGLVEDLAPGYLQITIGREALSRAAGGQTAGGQTAGGQTAGGQTAGGQTAGGQTAGGWPAGACEPADEPRLVTVTGYGDRWRDAAAEIRLALAESHLTRLGRGITA
jgi:tRNA threonylcarbamoyladenosine biosynthesis protein TsaE